MFILSRSRLRSFTVIFAGLLAFSFAFPAADVSAGRKHEGKFERKHERRHERRERFVRHERREHRREVRVRRAVRHNRVVVTRPKYRPGKLVVNLPPRHTKVVVRGRPYFYWGGVFYYRRPRGYVVVAPPIGTIVPRLAVGFRTVWVGGVLYYYYGNVFYRRVPAGYVVVEPPVTTTVVLQEPAVVQPVESATGRVSVIAARLNVRTGPSLSNPILYQVRQNTTLLVQGRDDGWLYVELPSGKHGWVMKEFTVPMDVPASG